MGRRKGRREGKKRGRERRKEGGKGRSKEDFPLKKKEGQKRNKRV